ncbi:MAG: leader peptidase (prepilin peptidase) / N-methyltransferase [Streptomyces sp.]|nr:leader peptidase (prepilin peptidase) / N-methyltransferase [Streptomyces sp.]
MHVYLTIAAAVWGLVTGGFALPRAAYRLAVEPGEPWRDAHGWVGRGPGGGGVPLAIICAVACAAVALRVGVRPEVGVWLLLVPAGALMARVDLAVLRLPDVLTLPAGAVTAAGLGVCALLPGHGGSWSRALLGGAALLALYFLLHLINPAGMGFGDVKLAPALGMALGWYGWGAVLAGTFAGFALGAVAGLTLLALRRADRKTAIPFGPFMLLGALGGVLLAAGQ